ncbi:polyribonucleotide nucleotidyltransferase [Vampirovibrio chlorellavorus]|uniref:polyribonucleotide nucleotidyltransferase n=1 Tax=Vampirovibrio chlorellavorus TaxID=758823 RepID=UPI0026F002FB|nr:polyribonucleotide nucleotidyltransferase [Vampirovibrio chlorellavorus]
MNEQILFPNLQTKTFKIGDKEVHLESGRLAKAATGSVLVRCDDTVLLVTATGSESPRPGIDFFPLLVDFEEKMYSVGRLPGGYLKREGKPSDKATLTSRLIDRPIRPLWPDGYRNDVQVVSTLMSMDSNIQPDVLAIFGASMALELSGLPFSGPVGGVRVARLNGQFIVNPTFKQTEESDLDLVVAGTEDSIMMVEAGANFISEEDLLKALAFAHDHIREQVKVQREFAAQCGIEKKPFVFELEADVKKVLAFVEETAEKDIFAAYHEFDRSRRKEMLEAAKQKVKGALEAKADTDPIKAFLLAQPLDYLGESFKKVEKRIMRTMIIEEGVRADGRRNEDIRPINCQTGILPRVHGSGLFTRGNTQALSVATLGSPGEAQRLDGVDPQTEKRWMHHYTFPGYSVGEVKPMRGAGRREIGHGALVERGILPVLPSKEEFGYTIRVNSDILESNGSTSMASTCGATLALMDAGVPIKAPVGGIAMGLIKEGAKSVVLSDIQGVEDFLGDMDFKVVGTRDGVTALQMDIKIQGISLEIMKTALEQAKAGRLTILDRMTAVLAAPRNELSPWAPRIITLTIDKDQIGSVIGPGGKMIRSIIDETGATIDIEDSGLVTITSVDGEGATRAKDIIERLTRKIERGQVIMGKVVRTIPIGAFVELFPGKDGMVHISQLSQQRVQAVEDVVKVGDEVLVKVVDIDERGRINLTMKGVNDAERAQHGLEPLSAASPN